MSYPTYEQKLSWKLFTNSVIDFGKYKGEVVEYLLEYDLKYLLWIKEKGIRKFSTELNKAIKEKI